MKNKGLGKKDSKKLTNTDEQDSPTSNNNPNNTKQNFLTDPVKRRKFFGYFLVGGAGFAGLGWLFLWLKQNEKSPSPVIPTPNLSKTPAPNPVTTTPIKPSTNPRSQTKAFEPIQETINIIKVNPSGDVLIKDGSMIPIQYLRDSNLKLKKGAIPLDLALIPKGTFIMGSPENEERRDSDESPQHEVNFPRDFYMGRYTITQAQWKEVMGDLTQGFTKDSFKGDNRPMVCVTWHDAQKFCKALNDLFPKTSGSYRLPTEAEWEYACRAGTTTPFHFGETITTSLVNYKGESPYANASRGENRGKTVDVDVLPANAWGLYQMHGNVWEWCLDEYVEDIYRQKSGGLKVDGSQPYGTVNVNNDDKRLRSHRGGCYDGVARDCRSADRHRSEATAFFRDRGHVGFRVVFDPSL